MNAWWIVLIVVAGVAVLYFGIGIAVRYHSGLHHCPEVLPNYRFWCGMLSCLACIATCGRRRITFDRGNHTNGVSILPSRPGAAASARGVQFELLASDADEDYDINRAMQPAEVIVKY
ncbi:putative transmembrane protein [Leptomonas pyrrhocoris]|uniref:Putative transmembrane protein n=1 Tax=Leptomonas pyrrhocoris TaxID=157538 RepID=A0A0M9FZ55_LEPPY|nr:putative transmembrane protein [Leptomonas pyrrhocoris]XP_015657559.1 putative transmembrane protein [Leptomonas pyrrhocoris]KPA79119.1 putative transmembrane protein [Leptomonas pyrrhocoris]KPA79120.1 putative transmembrane protein [Leptomonas pyrrhocoris]|eukprot:XP_015657558.1 putative transmembrane protein [Leptomonas pyrrhocoris]